MTECIECGAQINLPNGTVKGEIVDCPECSFELEVANPETGVLKAAELEGEDWGE